MIISLVLGAALCHAVWHSLIKNSADKFTTYAGINVVAMFVAIIGLQFVPPISWASVSWLWWSIVLHHLYKLLLIKCYSAGDLSRVFPIARGFVPVLVAGAGVLFAGDRLTVGQMIGLALISASIVFLAYHGRSATATRQQDVWLAVLTGAVTATYTLVDAIGARISGSAIAFVCWLYVADGILFPAIALWRDHVRTLDHVTRHWRPIVAAGLLSIASYGLVVWAMSVAPLGPIAAVRETSVVFAAAIGWLFMGEKLARYRIYAAMVIAASVSLIAWSK